MKTASQKITPCLWFDTQAEDAAKFYTSLFRDSKIGHVIHYGKEGHEIHGGEEGAVLTIEYFIENYKILGLNGGPIFKSNPSISLFVICDTNVEIERLWEKLSENGLILMPLDGYDWSEKYGWVQDKYGMSWQLMLREGEDLTQKISPSLLFMGPQRGHAEEAMKYYANIFRSSNIEGMIKYKKNEVAPEGFVKHAQFHLLGQNFMVMDAGMEGKLKFNEAFSFIVECKNQEEVDYYWEKLSKGGDPEAQQCGWLKDKFGVSWQIVPSEFMKMMKAPDKYKTERLTKAFMQMKKFDIMELREAFNGY